ncbi:MAG: hypothetical protein AAGD25_40675 [Cyanobacteria bacterium P01_F01_bin.150]
MDSSLICLNTDDYILSISGEINHWCEVWLDTNSEKYCLGSELGSTIIERLYKALCGDRNSVSGKDSGITLSGVITLAEKHSSIYVGNQSSLLYLYIRDADAKPLARIFLDSKEVESWKRTLEKLR